MIELLVLAEVVSSPPLFPEPKLAGLGQSGLKRSGQSECYTKRVQVNYRARARADPPFRLGVAEPEPAWRGVNEQGRQGADCAAQPSGSPTSQDSRPLSSHVAMPCSSSAAYAALPRLYCLGQVNLVRWKILQIQLARFP